MPRNAPPVPHLRRGTRAAGLSLLLAAAGCSGGRDAYVSRPDFTIKSPDLSLVELCPPKPPPPGTITPAEMAQRDKDLRDRRLADYEKQVADRNRLAEEGRKAAEAQCAAIADALAAGKPAVGAAAAANTDTLRSHLERQEDQLVTCLAFASGKDSFCDGSKRSGAACHLRLALLRRSGNAAASPPGAIADLAFEQCKRDAPKANCAGLRDAVRKGNPPACPKSPETAALCAVIAWRDPAKCPSGKAGEGCAEQARWAAALGEGKAVGLWPGDASADAAMADAVAGKADACKPVVELLRKACLVVATPPLPEEPRRPEDVPGAAPSAPLKKEGATPSAGHGLGGAPGEPSAAPRPAPQQ